MEKQWKLTPDILRQVGIIIRALSWKTCLCEYAHCTSKLDLHTTCLFRKRVTMGSRGIIAFLKKSVYSWSGLDMSVGYYEHVQFDCIWDQVFQYMAYYEFSGTLRIDVIIFNKDASHMILYAAHGHLPYFVKFGNVSANISYAARRGDKSWSKVHTSRWACLHLKLNRNINISFLALLSWRFQGSL